MAFARTQTCPPNSFSFNTTLCACNPGFTPNTTTNPTICNPFDPSLNQWELKSGVDYSISIPIFSLDTIKKFTQSQAVFLEATVVMLVAWLLFCVVMRFQKVDDGENVGFKLRWWISRLDFGFSTRHWLDDNKVVKKRKTELGGTFSVASSILFIGLFSALLYQIISRRSVEVHNVRATNAPDLLAFANDMEFNITTVSSMSCSHLRGLGTIVSGTPGFIDYRVSSLSSFGNYSCHNTSHGPTISLQCSNCRIIQDDFYISWQFVDLPNDPAAAIGFQFKFTAKDHRDSKHVSSVTGALMNVSSMDDKPITFRGPDVNILKFHLFPQVYNNLHDLRLIQPLFHEFLPGSYFLETNQLQASLQGSKDGLINTTLHMNFLSAYIIEIDTENVFQPVSFLADLGGLYAISFAIFFYLLVQCEYRIKKLRNEDSVLRRTRNRKRALQRWNKLRRYVIYTWGWNHLDHDNTSNGEDQICCCVEMKSLGGSRSLDKRRQHSRMDTISSNRKISLPIDSVKLHSFCSSGYIVFPCLLLSRALTLIADERLFCPGVEWSSANQVLKDDVPDNKINVRSIPSVASCKVDASQAQLSIPNDNSLPLPPVLELNVDSRTEISDMQRNLQNLYEYNLVLREKFIAAQSKLDAFAKKASDSHYGSQTQHGTQMCYPI
ncbi:hypothetical protein GIB67_007941 [Kingdonia uniflora]|uniref:Transmembrane protein n=1 Tax=Kingdonia uniflora TaxID=39325 RepID=A0A7J7LJH6_9MAGN|nr:hypothetical protein GIB67_007941 [Kingdonia uniflora]